jgi:methyl-accepting chemotaxis protein
MEVFNGEEKVGKLRLYYSDVLLRQQQQASMEELQTIKQTIESKPAEQIEQSVIRQLLAFGGVVLALIATIFWSLSRMVIRRIQRITAGLKDIAESEWDLTKQLSDASEDEIGELRKWFNIFVDKIQNIIRDVAGGAGNLDQSSGRLAALAESMKQKADATSVEAEGVSHTSVDMSSAMNSMAAAMEQATTNTNIVAAAAE